MTITWNPTFAESTPLVHHSEPKSRRGSAAQPRSRRGSAVVWVPLPTYSASPHDIEIADLASRSRRGSAVAPHHTNHGFAASLSDLSSTLTAVIKHPNESLNDLFHHRRKSSAHTRIDFSHSPKVLWADDRTAPLPPPGVYTLPALFIHQATAHPDSPFLTFYDSPSNPSPSLTYGQALSQVTQLARGIQRNPTKVVGIWFEKSLDLHLAILAATLSGAAWLPFDPDAPADRIRICLTDSEAGTLLCDEAHLARAKGLEDMVKVMKLDELIEAGSGDAEVVGPHSEDTAYMIYTSGSTGTPKGIAISHSAALTFALSERTVLKTCAEDIVWQGFSPAFDMFVEEVWISIAGGAHLIVGSRGVCQDVANLGSVWTKFGVTLVNAVPTMINIMTSLNDGGLPPSVRLLNLGGEACPPSLVKRLWRPDLAMTNTYGPTETTVTATFDILHPDSAVTIGKPLPSYHALIMPILDDHPGVKWAPMDIVPGLEGQLCIGGPCLGKGYVNRPELTAEKFMTHPLDPSQRLYQTGDRVRIGEDMRIHFLGRIDTQVKHRGFRIELGEIESALSSHEDVQVTAVICARAGEENAQLESYIVTKAGRSVTIASLKDCLGSLPSYMHPEAYFFLESDEMPRLPSGKINAKGLAELSAKREARMHAKPIIKVEYTGSLAVLMEALATVFPQAANNGVLTPEADFFDDLGGHSLSAAILVSRLRKSESGSSLEKLGLADIYQLRTPNAISEKYSDDISDRSGSDEGSGGGFNEATAYHEVKQWRWVLCGIAQLPPILFFSFIHSVVILSPYFVFATILTLYNSYYALLSAFACFVVFPPFLLTLGILGKWIILGRAKAGEYPLYGFYYYRWWLAGQFTALVDHRTWAELGMYPVILRLLGAKVGAYCHLGAMGIGPCADLLTIGDDVVVGKDVSCTISIVERGLLVIKPVFIGDEAHIGSRSVLDGGAKVEEGAELSAMTMVPDGVTIPRAQHWRGSPAQYVGPSNDPFRGKSTRPSLPRFLLFNTAAYLLGSLVMPLLWVIPQIPGLWLFIIVQIDGFVPWTRTAVLAFPSSLCFIVCVFIEIVILRRILLGKITAGVPHKTTSWFFLRKWLVDRSMDMSLAVLHPVYATLYVVPYLRAMGVRIGRGAEVSNLKGFTYDLTDIGEEAFVADNVRLGDVCPHANSITYEKTTISPRAFSGNSSLLPQGTHLQPSTLVGVLSIGPDGQHSRSLKIGESCFGSPPVLMPRRQAAAIQHDDSVLFRPTKSLIAQRLFIEGSRILLPRALIAFALGYSVLIFQLASSQIGAFYTLLMLPFYEIVMFCIPALLVTLAAKWILIGRYHLAEWPLWSRQVWFSEFCTSTAESLIGPLFMAKLVGTPYLPMVLRLLGVKIGKRCTLLSFDITEWDLVEIGDEVALNVFSGPQTHLFEDRVMKLGRINLADRAVLKPYTICLPNSRVGESSELGSLSLLMKGESVPAYQKWQGAPVARRAIGYGMMKVKRDEESGSGRRSSSSVLSETSEKYDEKAVEKRVEDVRQKVAVLGYSG